MMITSRYKNKLSFRWFESRNDKGFALISVVMISSLLILFAVSMLSLSGVESKSTRAFSHYDRAQLNARLALQLAIAELQEYAGPDQRVTANASILDTNVSSDEIDGVTNPNLVGVWESDNSLKPEKGYEDRISSKFKRWLISMGNSSQRNVLDFAKSSNGSARTVNLLGVGTLGSDLNNINAEVIDLEGGGFAWWAGDESLKAKINPEAVYNEAGDELIDYYSAMSAAPSPNPKGSGALSWFDSGDGGVTSNQFSKLVSRDTLSLLPKAVKNTQAFHHFTTSSLSLPVNVMDGGLKGDLSRAFASNVLPNDMVSGKESVLGDMEQKGKALYDVTEELGNSANNAVANGLFRPVTWKRVADYHRLSELVQWDGKTPYISFDASTWRTLRKLKCEAPLPVLVRLQTLYSVGYIDKSKSYGLIIDPIATLWNPYNVELRLPSAVGNLNIRNYMQSIRFEMKDENTKNDEFKNSFFTPRELFSPRFGSVATNMTFNKNADLILKPGEVKVFSDGGRKPREFGDAGGDGPFLNASPGLNTAGGLIDNGGIGRVGFGLDKNESRLDFKIFPTRSSYLQTNDRSEGRYGYNILTRMTYERLGQGPGLSVEAYKTFQHLRMRFMSERFLKRFWGDKPIERKGIDTSFLRAGNKIPLCVVDLRARTAGDVNDFVLPGESGEKKSKTLPALFTSPSHGSAVSAFTTQIARADAGEFLSNLPKIDSNSFWTNELRVVTDYDSALIDVAGTNHGFYGSHYEAAEGRTHVISKEIPLFPPMSIAAYRNFNILMNTDVYGVYNWDAFVKKTEPNSTTLHPAMNQVIGNSYAHPLISRDQHTDESLHYKTIAKNFYDHSYLLNHKLYDGWFHSGITSGNLEGMGIFNALKEVKENKRKLPNPRVLLASEELAKDLAPKLEDVNAGYKETAAHTVIDGGFNVNSTSLDAWKTILKSLRGQPFPIVSVGSGVIDLKDAVDKDDENRAPFSRFSLVAASSGNKSADSSSSKYDLWTGFRALNDTHVDKLAENIVEQVKIRGPFFSMADFVNRRLSSSNEDDSFTQSASQNFNLSLSGSLQTAIDSTDINASLFKGNDQKMADINNIGFPNPDAVAGPREKGASGFLSQGDLMQALGSILTVRGDTFVIRTYGESKDAKGGIQAKAWCEAVVQRQHDYLVADEESNLQPSALKNELNRKYGRKFKVVSFRWLNPDEV